jgi:hypothetical protein
MFNRLKKLFSWKYWWFWVALAVLIRLLIMPFTGHSDLFQTYTKSSFWAFQGEIFPSKFAVIWLAFHAVVLKFASFVWPGISQSFVADPITVYGDVATILQEPYIFRLLFIMKLPYLLLELVTVWLFVKLFTKSQDKLLALVAWLFNPYLYYSLYVFGRNEILAVFFIVCGLWALKKSKLNWASFALGLSIATRLFTVILMPVFLAIGLAKKQSWWKQIGLFVLPIVGSVVFRKLFASSKLVPLETAPISIEFFLPVNVGVGHGQVVYLLLAALLFISLLLVFKHKLKPDFIWPWSTAYLLLSLGLMFFHPHYFSWLTPFLAWFVVRFKKNVPELLSVVALQLVGWLLTLLFWGLSISFGLFAPINPHFFNALPSPMYFFGPYVQYANPINVGRTIILGTHLYMIYMLWPDLKQTFAKESTV